MVIQQGGAGQKNAWSACKFCGRISVVVVVKASRILLHSSSCALSWPHFRFCSPLRLLRRPRWLRHVHVRAVLLMLRR